MRTHIVLILVGLLPLGALAQAHNGNTRDRTPAVIAKDRAFNEREAIHESGMGNGANASSRSAARDLDGTNATTRAVLLANCPKGMAKANWLKLMAQPLNTSLYPLLITQAMLDTLDAKELDMRYRYVLVSLHGTAFSGTAR